MAYSYLPCKFCHGVIASDFFSELPCWRKIAKQECFIFSMVLQLPRFWNKVSQSITRITQLSIYHFILYPLIPNILTEAAIQYLNLLSFLFISCDINYNSWKNIITVNTLLKECSNDRKRNPVVKGLKISLPHITDLIQTKLHTVFYIKSNCYAYHNILRSLS